MRSHGAQLALDLRDQRVERGDHVQRDHHHLMRGRRQLRRRDPSAAFGRERDQAVQANHVESTARRSVSTTLLVARRAHAAVAPWCATRQ
jgi:hypothetical protein